MKDKSEMKILYLPLKKEWYEMIERGEKTEEYREITDYWIARLLEWCIMRNAHTFVTKRVTMEEAHEIDNAYCGHLAFKVFKHYHAVCFSYGYTKRRMTFECKGITIGRGRPEWGAPDSEVFIIKLGKRL